MLPHLILSFLSLESRKNNYFYKIDFSFFTVLSILLITALQENILYQIILRANEIIKFMDNFHLLSTSHTS